LQRSSPAPAGCSSSIEPESRNAPDDGTNATQPDRTPLFPTSRNASEEGRTGTMGKMMGRTLARGVVTS
jgi:hypothetical protein